jgi:hypothetical protein
MNCTDLPKRQLARRDQCRIDGKGTGVSLEGCRTFKGPSLCGVGLGLVGWEKGNGRRITRIRPRRSGAPGSPRARVFLIDKYGGRIIVI